MELYSLFWYRKMKPIHILGISCSTRILGLSVFYAQQLIDYAIKLNKEQWSNKKLDQIINVIQEYCTQHRITDISLTVPYEFYLTSESKELLEAITTLAKQNDIQLTTYPHADIYQTFANRANPTRASLIRRITMFYEELEPLELKELQNKNKYYIKLFEAVACASVHVLVSEEKQG